jgi:hypothetical protein
LKSFYVLSIYSCGANPFKTIWKFLLANECAIPRPIPLKEPVTIATRVADLNII